MTEFQRITASEDAMATMLEGLPTMSGPWDDAFHRAYCATCQMEDCAGENCPHQEIRRARIRWWMKQEVKL